MTKRFLIIAALALIVRMWTVFTEPLPLSGDEIAHGNYVGHIHEFWSLPDTAVANKFLPQGQEGLAEMSYEFYQPPGYYVIAALLGGGKPIGTRFVSVLMFMVGLCFVWAAAKDTAVVCALSFIPGLIVTTSVIGNDVFLLLGSAIMLYACVQQKTWAFVLGGLVLATSKFHGLPILLVIGVYYLIKQNYRWAAIGFLFAVVAAGIIWWRWDLQVENRELQVFVPTVLNIAKALQETLATGFLHPSYDKIPKDVIGLAVIGGLFLVYIAVHRSRKLPAINLYIVFAICIVWAGWLIFKLYPAGRYLYAAIPWLCLVRGKSAIIGSPESRSVKPARGHRRRS